MLVRNLNSNLIITNNLTSHSEKGICRFFCFVLCFKSVWLLMFRFPMLTKVVVAFYLFFLPWPNAQNKTKTPQEGMFFSGLSQCGSLPCRMCWKSSLGLWHWELEAACWLSTCGEAGQAEAEEPSYTQSLLLQHLKYQPMSVRTQFPKVLKPPDTAPSSQDIDAYTRVCLKI